MAPSSSQAATTGPRQSTISSFFGPKPTQPQPTRPTPAKRKGNSSSTPIALSDDDEEPPHKKVKSSKEAEKARQGSEAKPVLEPLYDDDDDPPDLPDFTAQGASTTNGASAAAGGSKDKGQSDFAKSFYASGADPNKVVDRPEPGPSTVKPIPKPTTASNGNGATSSFFKPKANGSSSAPGRTSVSATPAPQPKTHSTSALHRLQSFKHSSQPDPSSPTDEDPEKKARHEAFRKKLLVPRGRAVVYAQKEGVWAPGAEEGMLRGDAAFSAPRAPGDEDAGEEERGEDEDEEGSSSATPGPSAKGAKSKAASHLEQFKAKTSGKGKGKGKAKDTGPKYTPLEQQWLAIKNEHPDIVLLIEVGYKYRFFGPDALTASMHLSIAHFPSHNFPTASIPTHRVHIHVRRLVMAGLKVGLVRQTETRALKKGGENKGGPFRRELKEVWTRSTWVDGMDPTTALNAPVDQNGGGEGNVEQAWIVSLLATPAGGTGTSEKVSLALVGVCPQSGSVVWDEWTDSHLRAGLETRWLHLGGGPLEVVKVGKWDEATSKVVDFLGGKSEVNNGGRGTVKMRVEKAREKENGKKDFTFVTGFCRPAGAKEADGSPKKSKAKAKGKKGKGKQVGGDEDEEMVDAEEPEKEEVIVLDDEEEEAAEREAEGEWLKDILELPPKVISALAALIRHMQTFSLASIFRRPRHFSHLSSRSHMLLPGTTLTNLEIFNNATDGRTHGSLTWVLDRTKSVMGRRMLKEWIGRPLVRLEELRERSATVKELAESSSWQVGKLKNLVMGLPDLEKGLVRIHYGKCTPPELVRILTALQRVSSEFPPIASPAEGGFKSRELNEIVYTIPRIRGKVQKYLAQIHQGAAREERKADMFKDDEKVPDIVDCKDCVAAVDFELDSHLKEVRKLLNKPTLQFITVAQEELLLEIPIAQSKKLVPADWIKINGTKNAYRYRTPRAQELLEEREQSKERLDAEADKAFLSFLEEITSDYQDFRDVVRKLATADCLISLATLAQQPGYCQPTFVEHPHFEVKKARHPIVELVTDDPYVDNDITMDEQGVTTASYSGLNMGGKSSVGRMIASIVIMAQVGSYVPAESAKLGVFDSCYTRMGASDEIGRGRSTFMVELSETSDILKMATPRSLVVLDELGRGTSTHDGVAIASAVLHHLLTQIGCFTIFVTHYPQINQVIEAHPASAKSFHMSFVETHRADGFADVTFLYKIVPGPATKSHGLNVARMAGLPDSLLASAKKQAESLEVEMEQRKQDQAAKKALRLLKGIQSGADSEQVVALARTMRYAAK